MLLATEPKVADFQLRVAPNPVHQEMIVRLPAMLAGAQLALYDYCGKCLLAVEAQGETVFSMAKFPAGIYFLRLISENEWPQTVKVVKE